MEGYKKTKGTKIFFVIQLCLIIGICLLHAVAAGHYVDFSPINGTFQNFNPIRRLLNGQIPYRDFQDYLGLGHLYSGALVTLILGGNFKASLVAFSFLTILSISLCSLTIGFAVFREKKISAVITNVFLISLLIGPYFFNNGIVGFNEILDALQGALSPGNSARFVRGAILPVECLLIFLGIYVYNGPLSKKMKNFRYRNHVISISVGLIAGFAFPWSTDYGISCWVCTEIMFIVVVAVRTKKIGISILYFIEQMIASFIGTIIVVEIFTLGHLGQWAKSVFGTGGYQSWYYVNGRSYYIYDIDLSFLAALQVCICIVYIIKLCEKGATIYAIKRYGVLAFANMAGFCAINEYRMLSGGNSREVAFSVLFLTVFFEAVNFFVGSEHNIHRKLVFIGSICISVSWIVFTVNNEFIFKFQTQKNGTYMESLGGNLTTLGEDLEKTHKFLNGASVWATYASGQEVVDGRFQPSGIDYIIHVLGDDTRRQYMKKYEMGKWDYTATMKESYTEWEYWLQRSNWFFYRELYKRCHPVYSNTYSLYWEKNETQNQNFVQDGYTIQEVECNESTKKLIIKCDKSINGFADVYIDYSVEKTKGVSSSLVWMTQLKIENTGTTYSMEHFDYNSLRSKSKECIPIRIINGYGEVTLSSEPQRNTILNLSEFRCNGIYTVIADYVEVNRVNHDVGKTEIILSYAQENLDKIQDISDVELQNQQAKVINIVEDKQNEIIILTVDKGISYDENGGNQLHIIRH